VNELQCGDEGKFRGCSDLLNDPSTFLHQLMYEFSTSLLVQGLDVG
jgi:hypothetical protein